MSIEYEDETPSLPAHLVQEQPQLWERQPRETDREWAIFSTYRMSAYENQDPVHGKFKPRHLGEFADAFGLSKNTIYQLSGQYSWSERCAAYDRLVDRQKTHANLTSIARMTEEHRADNAIVRELVRDSLARTLDDHRAGRISLKPSETLALFRALQESERLTEGAATARTESRSISVSVALDGAPAAVRDWYRARALAAQNESA
jgi:hypothetical protein